MSQFSHQLVLNDWLLTQFGVKQFADFSESLHHKELSGFTDEGNSRFYVRLVESFPQRNRPLQDEQLRDYDLNIVRHWKQISEQRNHTGQSLYPLYFQYMALLLNEIYQDRYWQDREAFTAELNTHLHTFNLTLDKKLKLEPYQPQDLNKLAFWMATGAGKTLLMHVNILQTQFYLAKHHKQHEIEQVLLLTPNARLSEQHQRELHESGINADFYSKNQQSAQGTLSFGVKILHIHQLKDKDGDTTVAVGNFEGRNLVLVDEGHRGASGEEWLDKRERLCENGFSYEYSATFEQAIATASTSKKDGITQQQRLTQLYAKCILLDYSYRYFYNDGFGKDFHILNLESKALAGSQDLYMTGCLLAFFQQRLLYQDQAASIKPYLLDNPLCLFVGGTVTGKDLDEQQSDISLIVHFLAQFLSEQQRGTFENYLEQLLIGRDSLIDKQDQRVFHERFSYIVAQYHQQGAEKLYQDMRRSVFNTALGGLLHIEELKGTDGEIGLRVGDAKDHFAVINIGDTAKLCKLLEEERGKQQRPLYTVSEKVFAGSLFRDINTSRSRITLLIGAKKFTEGWSSWRVSTMGLLNIGKNKGSEIIQLFGRGVRLKGYGFGLQRSGFVRREDEQQHPEYLAYLETLNIFGIRASYMEEFRQLLEDQGLSDETKPRVFKLKVIPTPDKEGLARIQLQLLRPSKTMPSFKQTARPVFALLPNNTHRINVVLDWYPRVQSKAGGKQAEHLQLQGKQHSIDLYQARFGRDQLAFLDYDRLLFELLRFKNEKGWHNLQITRAALQTLLADSTWYKLTIPEEFWTFGNGGTAAFARVQLWQDIAAVLLKRYCERYYTLQKQAYEAPYLEYQTLESTDPNFIKEYQVEVPVTEVALCKVLETAETRLKNAKHTTAVRDLIGHGDFHFIGADCHLYFPLVELSGKGHTVKVKPVHLNTGEAKFVRDLAAWVDGKPALLQGHELYLLRNPSKSGVGFFEAGNFYPDFILWLKKDKQQWITFVDPKGLRNVQGLNHPKIQFAKRIKTTEADYQHTAPEHNIVLNSFILSTTERQEIDWWRREGYDQPFAEHHVLFQSDEHYVNNMMERVLHP